MHNQNSNLKLAQSQDLIQVTEEGQIVAEVKLSRENGCLFAHLLRSSQNPQALLMVLWKVRSLAKEEPIYLHVMYDNPDFERLVHMYEKGGAKKFALLMQLGE